MEAQYRPRGTQMGGFTVSRSLQSKSGMVPDVHTYYADGSTVILEEIDSVKSLVDNLERISPPSQIVAGLKDPLLQKYMALRPSEDSNHRLSFWLQTYFEDEIDLVKQGFGLSPSLSEILGAVLSFAESTKVSKHTTHPTSFSSQIV